MERGKPKKFGYPPKGRPRPRCSSSQTSYRSFRRKQQISLIPLLLLFPKSLTTFRDTLFLPFVSLVPLQMAVVKLQRLYHKIRFLPSGYRYGMSLVIRSSRKAGFSFWLGFSSSMMLWITSSVSLPSCINFFILIA